MEELKSIVCVRNVVRFALSIVCLMAIIVLVGEKTPGSTWTLFWTVKGIALAVCLTSGYLVNKLID